MADTETKFTFLPVNKSFSSLESKDFQDMFLKWSIKNRLKASIFTFDQYFQAYEKDKFALDFFKDPNVLSHVQVLSDSGKTASLGTKAEKVTATQVRSSILSMAFFDRLMEGEIARESGEIKKCFDEFFGDFTVSDNLRQMLLNEDSDVFCEYVENERDEFIFMLFSHICLGGRFCQYEDSIQPYLDVTKALYKDLISVQKNSDTKELSVISYVFKVYCYDEKGDLYFPSDKKHPQNFAYLIVDPLKRTDEKGDLYFPSDKKHPQNFAYLIVDPLKRTVICFSHTFGGCF